MSLADLALLPNTLTHHYIEELNHRCLILFSWLYKRHFSCLDHKSLRYVSFPPTDIAVPKKE